MKTGLHSQDTHLVFWLGPLLQEEKLSEPSWIDVLLLSVPLERLRELGMPLLLAPVLRLQIFFYQ